jgi:multidrug transporter EmrE-like cation transporter
MDSVRTTGEGTILAESIRPASRTLITAALVVLVHTVVMLVHGAAHVRLNIALSLWAGVYVLGIVGIGPIAGLIFLRSNRKRTGATILFLTMAGGLLFGLWNHFIAPGADHVMHLQASPWRLPFQATAGLLAVSELTGAIVAFMLLYVLIRKTEVPIRNRTY